QRPRRRDDEAARHRDRDVEIAVLEVELALTEVLFGVPPAHVVVHREPRVPLRDLVQPATRELLAAHPVRAVLGDFKRVCQLERGGLARGQRSIELRPRERAVHAGRERRPTRRLPEALHRADVLNRVSALEPATREAGVGRIDRRAAARRPIDVLVELEPEVGQRVGGVVGVVDRLAARDRVRGGIERRADGVVGALLPVAGPRAGRVPTTGSIVAATAAGAASIRWTAAKNRKFAASTAPAVRPATPRQAAAEGGGAGGCPASVSTMPMITMPPNASRNSTRTAP